MLTQKQINGIVNVINSEPVVRGAKITYISLCDLDRVLCPGDPNAENYRKLAVIIEECFGSKPPLPLTDGKLSNTSTLGRELTGAGLSCLLAAVSLGAAVAATAAEVPTVGAATPVTGLAWAGAYTGAVACGNGLARSALAYKDPSGAALQFLDGSFLYNATIMAVDALGVATGFASLGIAGRNLWRLMMRQPSFLQHGTPLTEEALKAMNRFERAKVLRSIFDDMVKTDEGRKVIEIAMREANIKDAQRMASSGISVAKASRVVNSINSEAISRIVTNIAKVMDDQAALVRDATITGASTVINAMPKEWVGSASGSVNAVLDLASQGTNWLVHVVEADAG